MKATAIALLCLALVVGSVWLLTSSGGVVDGAPPTEMAPNSDPARVGTDSGNRVRVDKPVSSASQRDVVDPGSVALGPSLLGASADSSGGPPPPAAVALPEFKDDVVRQNYQNVLNQIAHFERRLKEGEILVGLDLRTIAIANASKTCMEQQRFYYLGPPSQSPDCSKLQNRDTRYITTGNRDVVLILELTRSEFPAVFENDPKLK
jgi:hypothetical protein